MVGFEAFESDFEGMERLRRNTELLSHDFPKNFKALLRVSRKA